MSQRQLFKFLRIFVLTALSIAVTLLVIWISDRLVGSPVKKLENSIYDLAFKSRSVNKHNTQFSLEDIVIVDIDNVSIKELGRVQMWPRLYDAKVLKYISSGNPYAIGIDFLYTESDSLPPIYNSFLEAKGINDGSHVLGALSTDQALSTAIDSAQNVYLSLYEERDPEMKMANFSSEKYLRYFKTGLDKNINFPQFGQPQLPIDAFSKYAKAIGSINTDSDIDGVLRSYQILSKVDSIGKDSLRLIANFPFYMILDLMGVRDQEIILKDGRLYITDSMSIPLNKDGGFRINWLGSSENIRSISYYKLLKQLVPANFFENKIVFLGTSASGLEDIKTVPQTETRLPGVEVHANAFLNIVNQSFLKEISLIRFIPILLLIGFLTSLLFTYVKPIYALLTLGALLISQFYAIFPLFVNFNLMIPIVALMTGTAITGIVTNTYNYFTEQKQKRQLKNAFGTYVSSTVVNKIIEDPKSLMLGGTKKILSVLFSDIRGFTKYSENMDPQVVVSIINKYLSEMSEPVLAHEGTIDKFIGDAIFAIFGAPLEFSDHADEACEVALEMIEKLKEVNQYLIGEGYGPLKIGIGINTGEMTIGNIGSTKRFDYTAIGDSVNLGSRIEGLTKHFNVNILVSEFTKNYCKSDIFLFRSMPETQVQGKNKSVGIFELVGMKANRHLFEPAISLWEEAHATFMQKDFIQALELFKKYQIDHPKDVTTAIYIEKCEQYIVNPEEFTNSITMDNK